MTQALFMALALMSTFQVAEIEPQHASNPIISGLMAPGFDFQGVKVPLPKPTLQDSMNAQEQRAALVEALGPEVPIEEFLRDSVMAPVMVKVRNVPYGEGAIRLVDLSFVVYGKLDEIDLGRAKQGAAAGGGGQGGSMAFEARTIGVQTLQANGIKPAGDQDLYSHLAFSVMEKIGVETSCRSFTSISPKSLIVALQSVPEFQADAKLANRWWPMEKQGDNLVPGESQNYPGLAGYAKVSQLDFQPGALLIEAHLAFAEPEKWFNGGAALRSKLGLIAQLQVRALRREISKQRKAERPEAEKGTE